MKHAMIVLLAWLLALPPFEASSAEQARVQVFTLDGRTLSGTLLGADEEGWLTIKAEQGSGRVRAADVHLIRFESRAAPAGKPFPAGLLLAGGDYLAGEVADGDADRLVLSHPLLGRLDLPIDSIRILLPGKPAVPADFMRYAPASGEDVVFRKRDGDFGEDFIKGTVDLFSREGLSFDCSLGLVDFTFEQLNAVIIGSGKETAPAEPEERVIALLKGRSGRLSGTFGGLGSDRLVLAGSCLGDLVLSLEAVESLTFRRAATVYLSDLEAAEVVETPYLASGSEFLYPFKRDRSVTGRELAIGGVRFAKGLGVHAHCALSFDLDGAYSSFQSFAGLSDEVLELRARGSMIFRVLVDGREAFKSPVLRGGDAPVRLPVISVVNARRLTLEALYADGFDSGDRGAWGHALLVR